MQVWCAECPVTALSCCAAVPLALQLLGIIPIALMDLIAVKILSLLQHLLPGLSNYGPGLNINVSLKRPDENVLTFDHM